MIENKQPPSNKESESSTADESGVKGGSSWDRIRWDQVKWPDEPATPGQERKPLSVDHETYRNRSVMNDL